MSSPRGPALIPVWLVKEYYWCPMAAYLGASVWRPAPTESMKAGLEAAPRARIVELLEERHRLRELLWEHPVASRRLGVAGRVDLAAVTLGDGLVVVEAKLAPVSRRSLHTRDVRILAQLAAYAVAAEETLRLPLEAAYIYSTEADRLIEVHVTPRLRRLVEQAARDLHEMLTAGKPPSRVHVPRQRCKTCPYRHICPHSRAT